ncbi:hypothetical protein [Hoeflea sp. BAL378]|uniref:hypothetical protein n=1 Tax=Hoeflea sp. BAL378 TaxID=1547437 RepID=UPI000B2FA8CA|nr:hypothetical protein [Hoeflea sp. BAL378]
MIPATITIIDGTRLTQERARAARGTDAPALAAAAVITLFCIAAGLVAICMGS